MREREPKIRTQKTASKRAYKRASKRDSKRASSLRELEFKEHSLGAEGAMPCKGLYIVNCISGIRSVPVGRDSKTSAC